MARPELRMSEEEVAAFLARCRSMSVAALDDQGELEVAVAQLVTRDGELRLCFAPKEPIIPLLAVGKRVCAQADESPSYYEIKGIVIAARPRQLSERCFALDVDEVISFDFGKIPIRMT